MHWLKRFFPIIKKYRKAAFNGVLAVVVIFSLIFGGFGGSEAATYTFVQTDWSGGATANNGVHPTNQSGWDEFSSASSTIKYSTAGEISFNATTTSTTDTTDADFNPGTFSQTATSSNNTKLLIHADGTDGSTTFTDTGVTGHSITANGNAQVDTAQSKFGGASALFDGAGDYLSIPDHADFDFGSGDFTFDFWVRFNTLPADGVTYILFSRDTTIRNVQADIKNISGTYYLRFIPFIGGAQIFAKTWSGVTTGVWHHLAFVRSGTSWYVFVDGTQLGTTDTLSGTLDSTTDDLTIGAYNGGAAPFDGWLDEFRVSKGIARWTSDFTPPTSAYFSSTANSVVLATSSPGVYYNSGTYESASIDLGQASDLTTLQFNATVPSQIHGDYDLLIGEYYGASYGYENTGNATSPTWTAKSAWNLPDIGSWARPAFADLDNDGDYDLLIGVNTGISYGYENTGNATSPTWTAKSAWNLPDIGSWASPAFADLDNDGDYDLLIGEYNGASYGYENTGNATSPTWTAKSAWNAPGVGNNARPAFADLDNDGDYDLLIGERYGASYGYENTGNATSPVWTAKSAWNAPDVGYFSMPAFADLDNDGDYDLLIGESTGISYGYENTGNATSPTWTAKSAWNLPDIGSQAVPAFADLDNDAVKFQLAANNDNSTWNFVGPDGTSGTYYTSSGASIASVLDGNRYVKYKAYLSTSNTNYTPSLDDITINYQYYDTNGGALVSSAYDTTSSANILASIAWTENLPAGTDVKFQIRTAPDNAGSPGTWTGWLGPTSSADYYTDPAGGETIHSSHRDFTDDQWWQYKAFLTTTNTGNAPTLSDITMTYVVNDPPNFDSSYGTNGTNVYQVATSTDPDWGKVKIQYSVRDTDTTTGSTTPGYITPSFEYDVGGGWTAITSGYLTAGDLNNKAVDESTYNTYTATWDAKSQIPDTYSASAQIRVTANDNEAANNTVQATSTSFGLDAKDPAFALNSFKIDSSNDTIIYNFSISDDSSATKEYIISNNSDLSDDGANATSSQWNTASATTTTATSTWTFTGNPSYETVYLQMRGSDTLGNSATSSVFSAVAPAQPQSFLLHDISNTGANDYKEFINWQLYTATTSAAFSKYELYRSTNGTDFSLLTTITDINQNYYTDSTVASTTTYYYKLRIIDADGDISSYSTTESDLPDGVGGSDYVGPVISSVTVAETQATWARITWTTDELATSTIEYSTLAQGDYSSSVSKISYVTSHEITIPDLTANTQYIFRVKSTDVLSNSTTDDNSGSGYTFTTLSGPAITDVVVESINENGASIVWNTDKDSDSYVVYSTNLSDVQTDTNTSEVGSASLVGGSGPTYQHRVSMTGLIERTTYYFYVKSTDASSNTSTDKNDGSYYSFTTTYDTEAPVISNISTPVRTPNTIVVLWQTDELADTRVDYGLESGAYTNSTTLDSTLSIMHTGTISNLASETNIYYRVRSGDAQNNVAFSSEQVASTTSPYEIQIQYIGGGGGAPTVDSTPPIISDIAVSNTGAFEATVSFSTNEPTAGYVLYSTDTSYNFVSGSPEFKKSHSVKLHGLKLGTEYHYKVKAMDSGGNTSTSEDNTFTSKFAAEAIGDLVTLENAAQLSSDLDNLLESLLPSLVPPFVGKVSVTDVTENSAVVTWQTNVPTYGLVSYSSDGEYDSTKLEPYSTELSDTQGKIKTHSVHINGLSPATLYHLQARSFVFPGVIGKSEDITFFTKSSKISPEIAKLGNTDMEIRWITSEETSSFVEYRDLNTGKVGKKGDTAVVRAHSVLIDGLTPATPYELKIFGYDKNNNLVEADTLTVRTKLDSAPPIISSIKIDNALLPGRSDRLQTVISWRTDELSNSIVYFEEGIGDTQAKLANKVGYENEFTTDHIVIITAMKPSTIYRVKIASVDESGNEADSPARTILTPHASESVVDIIFKNLEESFGFLKNIRR